MTKSIYCVADARRFAKRRMPKIIFDYVDGAAGLEWANGNNIDSLDRMRLMPRVLQNVDSRDLQTALLGETWGRPFGIAPMGMCNLTCPGADDYLANAANKYKIPMTLSTMGSSSIEHVREQAGENAWFQLYVSGSEESAFDLVDRVKNAGYNTLILTVDVPQVAPRVRDLRNGFKAPLKIGVKQFIDFACHPYWSLSTLKAGAPELGNFPKGGFNRDALRGLVDWSFLDRLREKWQGKLIVKGVLNKEDAMRIKSAGADGLYVSNHGGRQLDSAPSSIECLKNIRAELGSEFPILFDSGIRNGESIVKAIAAGADFVMLGRSLLYGLGADGERGLQSIIDLLTNEVSLTMAQLGVSNIESVNASMLR